MACFRQLPSNGPRDKKAALNRAALYCLSYVLIVDVWLATHCHFPVDISSQVSVQRS